MQALDVAGRHTATAANDAYVLLSYPLLCHVNERHVLELRVDLPSLCVSVVQFATVRVDDEAWYALSTQLCQ